MTHKCRACESTALTEILDLGKLPLAGGFLAGKEAIATEQTYPLRIHVCSGCSLVQIVEPVDANILFKDYSFSSSTIGPLVRHFQQYAQWLKDRYQPASVLEIGCNDGVLLAPLEKLGVKACGVDISENITQLARERGLDVVTGYFDEPTVEKIRARLGPTDIVTG